jgi:hypothetical protein
LILMARRLLIPGILGPPLLACSDSHHERRGRGYDQEQ